MALRQFVFSNRTTDPIIDPDVPLPFRLLFSRVETGGAGRTSPLDRAAKSSVQRKQNPNDEKTLIEHHAFHVDAMASPME
jgi:hypothetical protein